MSSKGLLVGEVEGWGVAMCLYHCFRRSGLVRMVEAIRAPLRGGLEYMGRIKIFNCDSTLLASSASLQTTVKAPTRSPARQNGSCLLVLLHKTLKHIMTKFATHHLFPSEVLQKQLFVRNKKFSTTRGVNLGTT